MTRQRHGFTMVELLTVIAVIALISSFTFAMVSQARSRARDDQRINDLKLIQQSLELYRYEQDQAANQTAGNYPYPVRYLLTTTNRMTGEGVYPVTGGFKKYLTKTPTDPLSETQYVYFAPACVRPGKGTLDQPVIVSPAREGQNPPSFRTRSQIQGTSGNAQQVCPEDSGWVPYVLYGLMENNVQGTKRQGVLTNLAESSDKAVVYSPAQPLFYPGESNENGSYEYITNISRCYPARNSGCPTGFEVQ